MSSVIDKPADAPEHCPGPTSEDAGKGDACNLCPNKGLCSSGATKTNNQEILHKISERLKNVKNKIVILSGKGGVGKSTVTALLARALASSRSDINVAVLDIDICGPSQPRILGVLGESVHQSGSGWSPVYIEDNLSVMSIGFLLSSADDAIIWRGPKKSGIIQQFLSDVDWGTLDYLLIDSPPGTSDEHLSIVNFLSAAGLTGAIIITTPQEVALLDVRKEIDFCRKIGIKVIGVIENMSAFVCPNCKNESEIFPALTGGAQRMCSELNVNLLGNLPLESGLARATDEGCNYFDKVNKESLVTKNITSIIEKIEDYCKITS